MLTRLQCPSCNAPLTYGGTDPTIQCPYCDNTVVVPMALRSAPLSPPSRRTIDFSQLDSTEQAAAMRAIKAIETLVQRGDTIEAIKLYRTTFGTDLMDAKRAIDAVAGGRHLTPPTNTPPTNTPPPAPYAGSGYDLHKPASQRSNCLAAAIIALLLLIIGGVLAIVFLPSPTVASIVEEMTTALMQQTDGVAIPTEMQQPAADLTGTPAVLSGRFGAAGIGPGKFEDARAIAVDNAGYIYVGDYATGRIQVFDHDGAFQTQWKWGADDFYVDQFAADRSGMLYVPYKGELGIYEGMTGASAGTLPPLGSRWPVGGYSDSVAIGADGAIYAVWDGEVVRMNRAGEVTLRIANAIEAAMGEPETTTKIAVDGLGNIYALGISQDVLVKFDRSGVFVDRVAVANRSSDEAASKLRAATALAVDSRGWVYVADLFGIKIYDADGQYRATLDIPSVAFGLAIDDQDVLSIAARTEVLRYQLQP